VERLVATVTRGRISVDGRKVENVDAAFEIVDYVDGVYSANTSSH
jgi:hypothetical protein